MKLATMQKGARDGQLTVVSRNLKNGSPLFGEIRQRVVHYEGYA
ncbi:MAG: hypothetical protein JOZ83_05520 [Silvibacterium sp.]|nr:hypothetical protein [Silvibacterium sp.]